MLCEWFCPVNGPEGNKWPEVLADIKKNTKEDFVARTCLIKAVDECACEAVVVVIFIFKTVKK